MVQVEAIFDGKQIVLPPYVRRRDEADHSPIKVTVEFPDGELADVASSDERVGKASSNTDGPVRTVWDLINDGYQPKRSLDEALRELNEGRSA